MKQMAGRATERDQDDMRIETFDMNLLRVLDALLTARSVSGAARRLGLSQPATSAALARLRAAFGDALLVRQGNRMQPTTLAEELRPRITHVLQDMSAVLSVAGDFDPATTRRRFRISANDYASMVLLAPLAARLRAQAPDATLEIMPLDETADVRLAARECDLVVADRWSLRGIRTIETLFRESFVSVARADHPRLPRRVSLDAFLAERHALISPRGQARGVVDRALEAHGRCRHVVLTIPHYLAAPSIVAHTDLVMTLPRRVADGYAEYPLRQFPTPIKLKGFDVVMASHARSMAEPSVQWLKELLRSVASDIADPLE